MWCGVVRGFTVHDVDPLVRVPDILTERPATELAASPPTPRYEDRSWTLTEARLREMSSRIVAQAYLPSGPSSTRDRPSTLAAPCGGEGGDEGDARWQDE